jgi:class 3 adenylate cyclase
VNTTCCAPIRRIACLFLLLACCTHGRAQNLDSLRAIWLDPQQSDTARLFSLKHLIWKGYMYSQPDSALILVDSMQAFARGRNMDRFIAMALELKGAVHLVRGAYDSASYQWENAFLIYERIGRLRGMASSLNNLSNVSSLRGDHVSAIGLLARSQKIYEELGDKKGQAACEQNIGNIYHLQGEHGKAAEHFQAALALCASAGDRLGVARSYVSLGSDPDPEAAIAWNLKALALTDSIGDQVGATTALNNLANGYAKLGNLAEAANLYTRALGITKVTSDMRARANALIGLADVALANGRGRESVAFSEQAVQAAKAVGTLQESKGAYEVLYRAYKAVGDRSRALDAHERFMAARDSLVGTENQREVLRQEYRYSYEKQALADSLSFAAEKAVQTQEIRRQKLARNGFMGGFALVALFAGIFFFQRNRISKEKQRSEELLLNILPAEVAEELKEKGEAAAVQIDHVTVLFTDFKGFTALSETLSPKELVRDLNECFSAFDRITTKYGIEKIKTIGDAYMAAGGLPTPNTTHAVDVIQAALEMRDFIAEGKARKVAAGMPYFEIRIGVHTGPVVAGIVGVKKFQYDIWGDTVNTASRMESSGEPGQVNISEATYVLVRDAVVGSRSSVVGQGDASQTTDDQQPGTAPAFTFTPRGKVQAKGKGEMEMFFVRRSDSA